MQQVREFALRIRRPAIVLGALEEQIVEMNVALSPHRAIVVAARKVHDASRRAFDEPGGEERREQEVPEVIDTELGLEAVLRPLLAACS